MYEDMPGYVSQSEIYEETLREYYIHFLQADDSVDSMRQQVQAGQDGTESLQTFLDAAQKMQASAKKEPWFTWAHWQIGRIYTAANNLDDAIRAYEEALDWCTDQDPSAEERVRILVDLGIAHETKGNDEGAKCVFKRAEITDQKLAQRLIQEWRERSDSRSGRGVGHAGSD